MLAGQKIGPFVVDREIGSGAMGTVYRARYAKNNADVALKVISLGLDTNATTVARFERETAILKNLDHPNIVRLFGSGRYRKAPFYVMEFIDGESLDKLLERRGRFTWEEVVNIGTQVCAALQHAHEKGIIHRDLKPANIMMMVDGSVKLTDFGIAKGLEGTQLTATNSTVGTAAYMSPEQCRGEKTLTPRSDLYSLGVLFYELLTGRLPFTAETALDMFLAHTEGTFVRPARIVLDIPIWLDTLVCHLMEKAPEKRPYDAAAVAQALGRVVEKVAAQRSVGVDAVATQAIDRPKRTARLDQTDRETARLLRASLSGKRAKPKSRPLHERAWVVASGILVVLAGLGAILYAATRPPRPEKLYQDAARLMQSTDLEDWRKARKGPITDFLYHYKALDTPQAAQVHKWADQVDLRNLEVQLRKRLGMNISPDDEAERLAFGAARSEDAGERAASRERWEALLKNKESADADTRAWGLLAETRLADLKTAEDRERRLADLVEQARLAPAEPQSRDEGAQAVRAARAEIFGDLSLALARWRILKENTQKNDEARPWFLLAAAKVAELTPKAKHGADENAFRADLIGKKLEEAAKIRAEDQEGSRAICLDIVALYDKDPEPAVAQLVARAQRELQKLPAPPKRREG